MARRASQITSVLLAKCAETPFRSYTKSRSRCTTRTRECPSPVHPALQAHSFRAWARKSIRTAPLKAVSGTRPRRRRLVVRIPPSCPLRPLARHPRLCRACRRTISVPAAHRLRRVPPLRRPRMTSRRTTVPREARENARRRAPARAGPSSRRSPRRAGGDRTRLARLRRAATAQATTLHRRVHSWQVDIGETSVWTIVGTDQIRYNFYVPPMLYDQQTHTATGSYPIPSKPVTPFPGVVKYLPPDRAAEAPKANCAQSRAAMAKPNPHAAKMLTLYGENFNKADPVTVFFARTRRRFVEGG